MTLRAAFLLSTGVLAAACAAGPSKGWAADSQDPDWPCIQRLVPRISAAQVWAGPEPSPEMWAGDIEVARLASKLAARRTPLEDTEKLVEDFADAQAPEALNPKLTALFGRTLQIINQDRASIIAGIKRFAQHQRLLADRIRQTRATLKAPGADSPQDDAIPSDAGPNDAAQNDDLQETLTWDTRIFDEREKSMTYLCEQPVLLEQRAFALGRTIYFFVED